MDGARRRDFKWEKMRKGVVGLTCQGGHHEALSQLPQGDDTGQ